MQTELDDKEQRLLDKIAEGIFNLREVSATRKVVERKDDTVRSYVEINFTDGSKAVATVQYIDTRKRK